MAPTSPDQTSLASLLAQEIRAAGDLLGRLRDEHAALRGSDVGPLSRAVADKLQCMEELEQASRHRAAARDREQTAYDAVLEGLNGELRRLARDCHEQNQANGRLLQARRRHVEQVLAILRGQTAEAAGYGPGGETVAAAPAQSLAKA